MLNRRILRIKVLQAMYAFNLDEGLKFENLQIRLDRSIQQTIDLFLTVSLYLTEVADYLETYAEIQAGKYTLTDEEKEVSRNLLNNRLIVHLKTDPAHLKQLEKRKLQSYVDPDIVRGMFRAFITKKKYIDYAALDQPSLEQDAAIISIMLRKLFNRSKTLQSHMAEHFLQAEDDFVPALIASHKWAQAFAADEKKSFASNFEQLESDRKFAEQLLTDCFKNWDQIGKIVESHLINWDNDRMAVLDKLLLKMAVCEMLYCPGIPLKVSINEYIDISKEYSTPKSKDFINGVLDRCMKQLKADGLINKSGRGLVEF